MVAPVVYYYKVLSETKWRHHTLTGFRQTRPYVLPTAMNRNIYTSENPDVRAAAAWEWSSIEPPWDPTVPAQVTNKAYAKLVSRLGDSSSFGATLTAEREKTYGMLYLMATKGLTAAKQLKRFDFIGVARTLGLPPINERTVKVPIGRVRLADTRKRGRRVYRRKRVFDLPTGRTVLKTAANGWLLWSYGIKPLVSDVYNGVDILQRPVPSSVITAAASGEAKPYRTLVRASWLPPGAREYVLYTDVTTRTFTMRTRYVAEVSVENPNLWLANQMGLVNPVQWVIEGVPFSFVYDWFSNLSQVVNSMTDFVGLSVRNSFSSTKWEVTQKFTTTREPATRAFSQARKNFTRALGNPPAPKLIHKYERFEVPRALNALSLLIGFLPEVPGNTPIKRR